MFRTILCGLCLIGAGVTAGCGQQGTILPTDELTEAQKAAIKAEDDAVAMEESQGKLPKAKPKAKAK